MTEEQAAQIGETLARIATAVENIGRLLEEQRRPAPSAAATATSSIPAVRAPAPARPARRPTPA